MRDKHTVPVRADVSSFVLVSRSIDGRSAVHVVQRRSAPSAQRHAGSSSSRSCIVVHCSLSFGSAVVDVIRSFVVCCEKLPDVVRCIVVVDDAVDGQGRCQTRLRTPGCVLLLMMMICDSISGRFMFFSRSVDKRNENQLPYMSKEISLGMCMTLRNTNETS
jgi:hypothetical protein